MTRTKTTQIARGVVMAPSTTIHIATLIHHGNGVTGRTDCNRDINPKTWRFIPRNLAEGAEGKCHQCFS